MPLDAARFLPSAARKISTAHRQAATSDGMHCRRMPYCAAMFKEFFHKLPGNLAACFSGINLLWLLLAIALTYLLVTSGFDWWYYQITRSPKLNWLALAAGGAGFVIPVVVPLGMYLLGRRRANAGLINAGAAAGQAVMIAFITSAVLKAFTGRIQPVVTYYLAAPSEVDNSRGISFRLFAERHLLGLAIIAYRRRPCRDRGACSRRPQHDRADRRVDICVLHRARRLGRLPLVLRCGGGRHRRFADRRGGRQILSKQGVTEPSHERDVIKAPAGGPPWSAASLPAAPRWRSPWATGAGRRQGGRRAAAR